MTATGRVAFLQGFRSLTQGVLHVREARAFQALRCEVDALDGVPALSGEGFDVHVLHADYVTGLTVKCQPMGGH